MASDSPINKIMQVIIFPDIFVCDAQLFQGIISLTHPAVLGNLNLEIPATGPGFHLNNNNYKILFIESGFGRFYFVRGAARLLRQR